MAMDYSKPDESSTFTDYTSFLGKNRAYFDISKESSNLFELPDLQSALCCLRTMLRKRSSASLSLNPKLQEERFEDYIDFLREEAASGNGCQPVQEIANPSF